MSRNPQGPGRRMRGFEAASGLLRDKIRTLGESRGFALSRLLTHWADVVGEDVASMARPVKIGYGKGGFGATLTLLTTGAVAPIVQMQLAKIREKVNACYGYNAIARIHVTQTAATGFDEPPATFSHRPKPAEIKAPLAIRAAAQALSRDVKDENLRAALEDLAEKVLSRPRQTKG